MQDLKIDSVEMEGFRSFVERNQITFPDTGVVLISGNYQGSSMSSGSGKSSVMLAVAFALGFCDLPATELQSWYSDKMSVTVNLSRGEQKFRVQRNPRLSLLVDGTPIKGSVKELEAELDKILGLDRALVDLLTYRKQRSFGTFLSSTDSERKNLLTKLLSLQKIEDTHKKVSVKLSQVRSEISNYKTRVDTDTQRVAAFSANIGDLETQKKAFEDASVVLKNMSLPTDAQDKKASLEQINRQLAELNQKTYKIQSLKNANEQLKTQLLTVKAELNKAKESICPTCNREWHDSNLEKYILTREDRLKTMGQEGFSNVALLKSLEQEILASADLSHRRDVLMAEVKNQNKDLESAQSIYNFAKTALESTTNSWNMIKKLENEIVDNTIALNKAGREVASLEILEEIFSRNGFLGVIFDEVLAEIEVRANEMIGMIPNVSSFSCNVSSVTETKVGDQSKKISVKLVKDGNEVNHKSLSGGQQCAVELCLDLALIETIRKRTGSTLGWICLDEVMDGLGVEEKRHALEMISSKLTGQVLMIDHATEIKEGFQKIIDIEFDGRQSRAT
jgi:DNA repair exonuclease SbcCD ATPase subunit